MMGVISMATPIMPASTRFAGGLLNLTPDRENPSEAYLDAILHSSCILVDFWLTTTRILHVYEQLLFHRT
jgi:hypothetical protein